MSFYERSTPYPPRPDAPLAARAPSLCLNRQNGASKSCGFMKIILIFSQTCGHMKFAQNFSSSFFIFHQAIHQRE
ncbi:hypothetical protein NKI95_24125 [Mesorhizobium sp. M0306]|uniref:hypothetical protein n=1 Tax=Mesorhizobium sp. M0306 TaxID=2956932 RepID=UPI0033379B07